MKHTLTNRMIIGKTIGFVTGGLVFFLLPVFGVEVDTMFRFGLWLFYMFIGVLTAFMGIMDHHPIFHFKMPFWFRGILVGITMHAMLVLLAYSQIESMAQQIDIFGLGSPWWALLDGLALGLLMSWAETKFAGEGEMPLS